MSLINSSGERLRRATALWHAYLAATGQRFDLVQFLKDPVLATQVLDGSLVSGDAKLIGLAQEWLRDTGQVAAAAPSVPAARVAAAPASGSPADAPKGKSRYLRGVR